MAIETLTLSVFGITIKHNTNNRFSGEISSYLRDGVEDHEVEALAALDAIESLILAHFCAGVDIQNNAYLEGIEVAVEAIHNRI